jgi:hypothetical protein
MRSKVVLEQCDNPSCRHEAIVDDSGEGGDGFHFGKGYWVNGGGGSIPAIYAHSRECILPAFDAAMKEKRS